MQEPEPSRAGRTRTIAALVALLVVVVTAVVILARQGDSTSPHGATGWNAGPWFQESAARRGILFQHRSGAAGDYRLPEIMAGGAAMFDMDGDADLDIYLVQSGLLPLPREDRKGNTLYRNRGDGTFESVSGRGDAEDRGYGMGVCTGDYDNDGDVDLYVTNVDRNTLLANNGSGRFTDVTEQAGVGGTTWSASAAFLDYDRDGDLDLFVANYLQWPTETDVDCTGRDDAPDYCSPQDLDRPVADTFYRNEGDGTFVDVTAEAGIRDTPGTGLGVVCGDFDGDGWEDIFVANDGMPDRLWINTGNGRFEDHAAAVGVAVDREGSPRAGMGVTASDIDDDTRCDLLVCNLEGQSDSVYRNAGDFFVDGASELGLAHVSRPFTRFGVAWMDFDNDTAVDLFQANGRVTRQERLYIDGEPYAEPNLLFRGSPDGGFSEVRPRGGADQSLIATSRAAAFGDVDNDGRVDILLVNRDGPTHLLMNTTPSRRRWLTLRIVDEHDRDALGVVVTAMVDTRTVTRRVRTAYSYLAANDPRIHLGLGDASAARSVTVRWIDGTEESFGDLAADQIVTLRRGEGR